jgi:hypothetical protein
MKNLFDFDRVYKFIYKEDDQTLAAIITRSYGASNRSFKFAIARSVRENLEQKYSMQFEKGNNLFVKKPFDFKLLSEEEYWYLSINSREFQSSKLWIKTRDMARDMHPKQCMCCGTMYGQLHVDHIHDRLIAPELAFSLKNLQILCRACNYSKPPGFDFLNQKFAPYPPMDLLDEFLKPYEEEYQHEKSH